MGLQVGWSKVSGNHQGGTKSVSQVDRETHMAPLAPAEKGLSKGIGASAITSVWEKAVPPALTPKPTIQFLPCSF